MNDGKFCAGYVTGLLDKTQADAMCAGDKAKAQKFANAMCSIQAKLISLHLK